MNKAQPPSQNADPNSGEDSRRRDELLRRALATPPISNEEIVRRSKAQRKR